MGDSSSPFQVSEVDFEQIFPNEKLLIEALLSFIIAFIREIVLGEGAETPPHKVGMIPEHFFLRLSNAAHVIKNDDEGCVLEFVGGNILEVSAASADEPLKATLRLKSVTVEQLVSLQMEGWKSKVYILGKQQLKSL